MRQLITLSFFISLLFSNFIECQTVMTCNSSNSSVNTISFIWDDDVVLNAEHVTGEAANIIYDNEFNDKGFGIDGARWKQIDFYQDYQGASDINASEKLIISFNGLVENLEITVGMMGLNEGIGSDDETGKWTAYDLNNIEIGNGEIGPADSNLGVDVKISGSYGKYPFDIDAGQPIAKLVLEATGFGYNSSSGPKYVNSYNNDSGNNENNSDFNLFRLSYDRQTTLSSSDIATNRVAIFPNPVDSELNIYLNNIAFESISLFDISGKKVKTFQNNRSGIDVSDLKAGVYLLKIQLSYKTNFIKRLVKL